MNLDPHMLRLANILVGICVREIQKGPNAAENVEAKFIPADKKDWNDDEYTKDTLLSLR